MSFMESQQSQESKASATKAKCFVRQAFKTQQIVGLTTSVEEPSLLLPMLVKKWQRNWSHPCKVRHFATTDNCMASRQPETWQAGNAFPWILAYT